MCLRAGVAAAAALAVILAAEAAAPSALAADSAGNDDEVSLLQHATAKIDRRGSRSDQELVLVHIPYNFGHTVENVAMFGSGGDSKGKMIDYLFSLGGFSEITRQASWKEANFFARPGGEVWGHLNPDLQVVNEITGCPMYYSPQKYWPKKIAEKYIGNKTVFGMLRDPYERLVAFFRGSLPGYGGNYPEELETCDVNSAVKKMMKRYIEGNNTFAEDCTFLPQAEFFEGPYGITLPINNREFPSSMNQVFMDHGYKDFLIESKDILHVSKCNDIWAGDLDKETRSMVRQVYARDFELLCKHFGYCDDNEDTCIWQVPQMCPQKVLDQGYQGKANHHGTLK